MTLWDGTVYSGTLLTTAVCQGGVSAQQYPAIVKALVTPAAGAKTYNVGISQSGGVTAYLNAAATQPAYLIVKAS